MNEPGAAAPRAARRRRPLRRRLLFAFAPLLLLAGGTEAVCQVRLLRDPQQTDAALHRPDPYCGYRMHPGLEYEQVGYQGTISIVTNELGHRTPSLATPKPAGVYRIACLGGSTTFGFGARTNDAAYPAALQRRLGELRPELRAEVFNAGVQGWNLRDSITNYQLFLEPLGFDLVVIMHAHNDLYEAGSPRYLARSQAASPAELRQEPGLLSRLVGATATYRVLSERLARHRLKHYKLAEVPAAGQEAFERNLRFAIRTLRGRGTQVALVTFPHIFAPTADEARRPFGDYRLEVTVKHCPLAYPALVAGLADYNERIRRVGAEEGVTVIDLAREFPADPALYVDFIHHTDAGHARKAELILQGLLRGPLAPAGEAPR